LRCKRVFPLSIIVSRMSQPGTAEAEYQYLESGNAARITGLTPAGINAAAEAGRLLIAARTRRGTRLFRVADVEAFARARASDSRVGRWPRR